MLDIRILSDSPNTLYCQRVDPRSNQWGEVLTILVLSGLLLFFATHLYRRSRMISILAAVIVVGVATWFTLSIFLAGPLVHEFEIDRAANKLIVQAFYEGNDTYQGKPLKMPLDQVLRADIESTRYGSRFVFTLRDHTVVYPLGSDTYQNSNDFFIMGEIRQHLVPPQAR
jgi:hypothetical protein